MGNIRSLEQEQAEDIFFGQVVIIWARWFLILCGMILAFWIAKSITELFLAILPIAALMAINFFFHGRYILERPANRRLVMVSIMLDLLIVAAIVTLWPGGSGAQSQFYIFYYPLILAVTLVFPSRPSIIYLCLVLVSYVGICFIVDWTFIQSSEELEMIVQRVVTLAATGGLGLYYWRIQRDRRRALQAELDR